MAKPHTDVDEKDLAAAKTMWKNFTILMKWSSVATAAVLIMMLVFIY